MDNFKPLPKKMFFAIFDLNWPSRPFLRPNFKGVMNKLAQYIQDSRAELKKVVWPSKKETRNHTLMVIGISLAVAAFLGLVDYGLNLLLKLFIR